MHADYTGKGFDQLMDVIDKIKNNPDDRRIILSAWNPSDLKKMALPPCHMFAQVSIVCLLVLCLVFNYWAILICPTCYPCTFSSYFFLEYAGELRIFALRGKRGLAQFTVDSTSPWTRVRAPEPCRIILHKRMNLGPDHTTPNSLNLLYQPSWVQGNEPLSPREPP